MQKSGDVAAPGTLLTDAARELGQLKPDAAPMQIGQLNIQMVQQILALPQEALESYLRTGRLPADSYLADVSSSLDRDPVAVPSRSADG